MRCSRRIHAPLDHKSPAEATRKLFGLAGRGPAQDARLEPADAEEPEHRLPADLALRPRPLQLQVRTALQLTVTLEETDPPIWRELWVDERVSLADLHRILQVALGWSDRHLYEFEVGGSLYGDPNADVPTRDARRTRLSDLDLAEGDILHYTYDFGDDWPCVIRAGDQQVVDSNEQIPRIVAGERAGPPEDCGGVRGLEELLEVLADPAHPEHESHRAWVGEDYEPERFDLRIASTFLELAVRWQGIRAMDS